MGLHGPMALKEYDNGPTNCCQSSDVRDLGIYLMYSIAQNNQYIHHKQIVPPS